MTITKKQCKLCNFPSRDGYINNVCMGCARTIYVVYRDLHTNLNGENGDE